MTARTLDMDFRLLFESAPGLFLVLRPDAEFTILGASDAYLRATHTERAQIVGRRLFEMFPDNPEDPNATGTSNLRASLERVVADKVADGMAVQKYDVRRPDAEGGGFEERFWSPVNSPVLGPDGQLLYIVHRVEDVTDFVRVSRMGQLARERSEDLERRSEAMELEILSRSRELDAANKRLRSANEALAELDKAKTTFFSNISHEFRTPLTLMLGPVEDAISDTIDPLPARQRERFELVQHNALRLLKLVNALLDFSRIEAGRMRATYVPTDIARLTRELASAFRSAAEKAGLQLTVDCPPTSEPAYVDRDMWEKMVLNLVSNAFKFTFEGEVAVRLREEAGRYVLAVEDTGTGIPPDEVTRVFERFHRVQGARSRSHEGTGIGLSLVQELAKLHGGTVAVESALGKGTIFTVAIPRGSAHLPPDAIGVSDESTRHSSNAHAFAEEARRWLSSDGRSAGTAERSGGDTTPERLEPSAAYVLVVDDNADLRGYMAALLAPHYHVDVAVDGQAALERIRSRKPALVLSDVMMPRMDGFDLLRALRSDEELKNIPVILLSARAGEDSAIQGLEAGADDYLIKPFSARELLARVRTHVGLARSRQAWAAELERANQELEAFSYSVSHDLRAPLRAIDGFGNMLLEDYGKTLDATAQRYLAQILAGTQRMAALIDDLLALARINRASVHSLPLSLTELAQRVAAQLRQRQPSRRCEIEIADGLVAHGNPGLITILLENLLGNAWKFTAKKPDARIAFGLEPGAHEPTFFVRDNGAGFDMKYVDKLFAPFQRLHAMDEFDGSGIGLATVQRIVARHGGRVWAEGAVDQGATFYFTLAVGR